MFRVIYKFHCKIKDHFWFFFVSLYVHIQGLEHRLAYIVVFISECEFWVQGKTDLGFHEHAIHAGLQLGLPGKW